MYAQLTKLTQTELQPPCYVLLSELMQQYASEILENKHFIDWNTDTLQICNMEQTHIHRSVHNNNDERPPCYVLLSELSVKSLFDAGDILNDCCYYNVSTVN